MRGFERPGGQALQLAALGVNHQDLRFVGGDTDNHRAQFDVRVGFFAGHLFSRL